MNIDWGNWCYKLWLWRTKEYTLKNLELCDRRCRILGRVIDVGEPWLCKRHRKKSRRIYINVFYIQDFVTDAKKNEKKTTRSGEWRKYQNKVIHCCGIQFFFNVKEFILNDTQGQWRRKAHHFPGKTRRWSQNTRQFKKTICVQKRRLVDVGIKSRKKVGINRIFCRKVVKVVKVIMLLMEISHVIFLVSFANIFSCTLDRWFVELIYLGVEQH